jgi:hypothetical protein
MEPHYPSPIILASTTGTGVQPDILDISAFMNPGYPPVLSIYMSAAATVKIWGGMSLTSSSAPSLVRKIDVSGGGFTGSNFYDMIPGIPFYQVEVIANAGLVVVEGAFGPTTDHTVGSPQLIRMSNIATAGM